jgi:hypothetical protein
MRVLFAAIATMLLAAQPALADDKSDAEAFMWAYLERWNAHDAGAITARYYRLDGNHPWSTEAGMRAEFDRLKGLGYDKSDIQSVISRQTGRRSNCALCVSPRMAASCRQRIASASIICASSRMAGASPA